MTAVTVRRATVDDARGIAEVHVTAWREAYAGRMPADFLASLDVDRRAAGWTRILERGETDAFVAERDGTIVGWATAGRGRDDDAPRDRELEGIYLLASAYGSGAGQQLLDAAVGDAPAYLWVMDGNGRAEAFYRRNGFTRDGATMTHPAGDATILAVRMTR
ncbi:L-amino acid N-acyltransferase YncA [Leifsonia sp. 98AMF]|uniref:GNAT family N-acetyltransferase n=1 Tax=unclassified Leifsonia TaxID=2663824 RepID=UPI00087CCC11|nr:MULTISPECIES: GNAT family N-acetyltransferase [unclassified Leifsonia]SDH30055.1 L-amino acid N-acyltransferase YncA [Leifsonia sp. 197AMF]SDJ06524.1 L-amino acid N-acyltransferase YncA [Leifsonia sp. 466MF]SDJ65215.1 L-amino acid N-acyltransferase YncA [Leifsonia sp. 157MF]SDN27224.1 L-amino acid N-acyltransferase YncA [Leifsonia sp. 509MF]SEM93617.1 L-amino acid N-acyltransferase YncA [Leifsonia sp. 467MF]